MYARDVIEAANQTLFERRREPKRQVQRKREQLLELCPAVPKLEQEIAQTGVALLRLITENAPDSREKMEALKEKNLQLNNTLDELIRSAGFTDKDFEEGFYCTLCKDTGYVNGKLCRCVTDMRKEKEYEKLSAMGPLSLCSFDNFDLRYYSDEEDETLLTSPRKRAQANLRICREFSDALGQRACGNLLMYGETGLGKTHLSFAIAQEAIAKGLGVVYGSAQNLIGMLEREHFGKTEETGTEESLLGCDLLILDDLGAEFTNQFVVSVIYNIVNTRLMRELPTVINTNLTMKQLEERYSQRIVSRMIAEYKLLRFFGKDIRQQKREEELRKKTDGR